MKIRMSYHHLPTLEIEAAPEECARLLRALATDTGPPKEDNLGSTGSSTGNPSGNPVIAADRASTNSISIATESSEANQAGRRRQPTKGSNQTQPESPSADNSARTYAGRTNRRFLILESMRFLRQQGQETPTLNEITDTFATLFPDVDRTNLEQVVRDLANKTAKVERMRWGVFRLTEDSV